MRIRLFLLTVSALLWQSSPAVAAELVAVKEVQSGKTLLLEDGRTVRLASLQVPNVVETTKNPRPGEPLGEEAKRFLAQMLTGKKVKLEKAAAPDRRGRVLAQAYDESGRWMQKEMVVAGMGYTYLFADTPVKTAEALLAAEDEARAAKKGIWALPEYAAVAHQNAGEHKGKYRFVRGTPEAVENRGGTLYLNFGEDWKTDFTVSVSKKYAKAFDEARLRALVGKPVEARGWIGEKNGPMIEAEHPLQVRAAE